MEVSTERSSVRRQVSQVRAQVSQVPQSRQVDCYVLLLRIAARRLSRSFIPSILAAAVPQTPPVLMPVQEQDGTRYPRRDAKYLEYTISAG